MPTQKLVQNAFTSGQYDRTAQGQEGGEFVARGMAKSLNVMSSDSGQLYKRLGTKHLSDLTGEGVLVPFRLPSGDDILLLCTDNKIRAYEYQNGEISEFLIPDDNAPVFPTSGWNSATNGNYTVSVSPVVSGTNVGAGFNQISGRHYYGQGTDMDVPRTTTNATSYTVISSVEPQLLQSLIIRWCLTCSGNHTGHYKGWQNPVLQYSDDGNDWISVQTDVRNPNPFGGTDAYRASYHYGSGSGEKTENYVAYKISNVSHQKPHRYWRVYFLDKISNKNVFSGERLDMFVMNVTYLSANMKSVEFDTNFTTSVLKKIKYDQQETMMIMCADGAKPIQIDYSAGKLTKKDFTAVDTWGTPSCCCFFQNRLWFAGFEALPTTVLASKFGVYDNFTVQTTVQYDDYLNLKCNQLKNKITNITGGYKVLYCFSEDGISFVDGGSGGLVATNQNIEFLLKNKMPAGDSTPTVKDDVLLYVSSDGTKLYSVDFDLIVDRFQVIDLAKYAKDVVNSKIDELHYVNDSKKLVYGLLENQSMFALLYEKNALQGFFPIDMQNAYIYDIVPFKKGRDYKLLCVVNRSDNWVLEEFNNTQDFINTAEPLMSKEEKKWATYDNLENNIALDSYRKYDEMFSANGTFDDNNIDTTFDFSAYIGKRVMLGQLNDDKKFAIVNILDQTSQEYYAYQTTYAEHKLDVYYSTSSEAVVGAPLYTYKNGEFIYVTDMAPNTEPVETSVYYLYRYPSLDKRSPIATSIEIEATRGEFNTFDIVYPEFDKFNADISGGLNIGVISEGRYIEPICNYLYGYQWVDDGVYIYTVSDTPKVGDAIYDEYGNLTKAIVVTVNEDGSITAYDPNQEISRPYVAHKTGEHVLLKSETILPYRVFKVTYGIVYDAYAYIKIQKPYESMKSIQQIDLAVIDTMHLEVGTCLGDMQELEKINASSHYDLTNITLNGIFRIVPSDTPEWEKNIILRSSKGLPFTVNAVEVFVNYSNMGGN